VDEQIYSPAIRDRYSDVELVIGCGDLPFYYLEFIVTMLPAPVLYVRGNHDDRPYHMSNGRVATHAEGCEDLHGKVIQQSGLLIAGIQGSRRYRPDGQCMYSDEEVTGILISMLPKLLLNRVRFGRYLDLLVAHSPPFSIHDRSDLAHTGFKPFLPFMRRFRPRYLLHGHVHDFNPSAVTETRYYDTFVVNVYPRVVLDIPLISQKPEKEVS
jgi:Icc-related predicted phosphoesterase